MRNIIIGSRRSNLAITQTEWVIDKLNEVSDDYSFDIKKIVTRGDQILDVTLSKVGGKALFVKEIEQAMYNHEIDLAVHSMKDVPSEVPEGLPIGSIPEREDHRDAFISENHVKLDDLKEGALIGTSSLRRGAQLQAYRPDLRVQWIRGNIETRLRKLQEEDFDAIILAAAGLKRMGWSTELVTEFLEPDVCLPAVGQGALALQCREDDEELRQLIQQINDEYTAKTVTAERQFLSLLEGSCSVPIGAYAVLEGDDIVLQALVSSSDGETVLKETVRSQDPLDAGEQAAKLLIDRGAKELVEQAKQELEE
ncbi:hydroxymethylbilane synthase [Alkalibacillus flavidus]|uniref:Porphobilinogen deaminase n=1 Tax=Alkalibacillus flavidus TaxID=546021 RepID=A0ABV2KSK5_9BACI